MILILPSPVMAEGEPDPSLYPGLKKIASVFAQNFDLETYRNEDFYRFNFIRDPSGWYVLPQYYSFNNQNRILIWSFEDKYPPHIETDKSDKDIMITRLISNQDLYDFTIHPFYGYSGWMEDVIQYYEEKETAILSDNELYGLGRAYAQKASDLFWSHSQYSNPSLAQGTEAGKRDARLYLQYARKCTEYFRILYERSPEYQTLVGLMDIKYANEVMDSYYELKIFGFDREAENFLDKEEYDKLYQPFWEKYAREILTPLEKNGILFTNGDNDTYPLIWVQEVKNYRKDIKIINLSLLRDPLYFHLISGTKDSKKTALQRELDKSLLLTLSETNLLIDDEEPLPLSFEEELKTIANQLYNNNPVITIPNGFYIIKYLTNEAQVDTLRLKSGVKGNILSASEFLLQGIINKNIGRKPLYFIKGMQPRIKSMFDKNHLVDKGLYYSIEKRGENTIRFENNYFDTAAINDLLKNSSIETPDPDYFSRAAIFNLILEAKFMQIYSEEINGDNLRKHELMLNFVKKYTPDKTGINYYYLFLIENLYHLEQSRELAKESFDRYFEELKNNILKTELSDDNPRDIQSLKYFQSILSLIKLSSFYSINESLKEDISFLEKTIEKRLFELPELEFQ